MRKIVYMFQQHEAPHWFRPAMPKNYPIEYWQPDKIYSTDTVFYYDMYGPYHDQIETHLSQGHRVIFDAKNEHYIHHHRRWVLTAFEKHPGQGCFVISGDKSQNLPGVHIIATPYWYWIMDQANLRHFGLDQYRPQPKTKKKFFMSIGLQRPDRDYLYERLGNLLNDSIHSYRDRGVFLPNDWQEKMGGAWQRYINTDWLDASGFTLVVETFIDDQARSGFSITHNDSFFLCEKSYKPMACQHPILMASTQGNLGYLRSQGFETFPELWDETYDDITDWHKRIDRIVEIVREFDPGLLNTPIIKQKLLYNSTRFFDQSLTKHLLNTTIVEPVLEFVNE